MNDDRKMKLCRGCKRRRMMKNFNRNSRHDDGRDRKCKDCRRDQRATLQPPGFGLNRKHHLKKRYGITPEQFDEMVASQQGVCAICMRPPDLGFAGRSPKLLIDHNHVTGKVRALLCFKCNTRLATIEDEQFMLRARAYLRHHDGYEFTDDQPVQRWIEANHPPERTLFG